MKLPRVFKEHSLFFTLLVLFLVIAVLDLVNVDSMVYKTLCGAFSPVIASPCTDYYDVPIWQVYLSVAILAALYHVHGELKISNKHLASHKH